MVRVKAAKIWMHNFKNGLRSLSHHNPEKALKHLKAAIKACPVHQSPELAKILYFAGITLRKIGCYDGAVKSWKASYKIRKFRFSYRHLKMFSNEYGMFRQSLPELDDWRAFYSIHLGKYLRTKKSRTLGTLAEQDMIRDLIFDAWQELSTLMLSTKTTAEKLAIFKSVDIIFPYFVVPDVITGNNLPGTQPPVSGVLCPCGSGLPFAKCCGAKDRAKNASFGSF